MSLRFLRAILITLLRCWKTSSSSSPNNIMAPIHNAIFNHKLWKNYWLKLHKFLLLYSIIITTFNCNTCQRLSLKQYRTNNCEDSSFSSSCFIISLFLSDFTSRHKISCRMSSREMAHSFTMVKLTESPQVAFSLQNLVKLVTESTPR